MLLLCVVTILGWLALSSGSDGDSNLNPLSPDVIKIRTQRTIGDGSLLFPSDPYLPDPSSPSGASTGGSAATASLPPQLLETPLGGYVSRSQPVSLRCRAEHVLHVYFRCNGEVVDQHREHTLVELVDPQTGVRQLEKQLMVEWRDVEEMVEVGGGDGVYRCECVAWSGRGENVSDSAEIRLAYLRKQFRSPPFSESVEFGHSAELRCVPPEGSPAPSVSWLKDGVSVSERVSENYMVTGEANLLVVSARLEDMANYSCVAENTANRRVSPPALLTVHVNGGWSEWGSWSPCSPRCGEGQSYRRRRCDSPRPVNGGLDCIGSSSQQRRCSTVCQPVNGGWSEFGAWSPCDSNCLQFRSRSCSHPLPAHGGRACEGQDTLSRNCTHSMCSDVKVGMERRKNEGVQSDVALYSGLAAALLLVTVAALVLVRLHQRKPRHRSVYGLTDNGYEARFYSSKKQLTYTPDLTSDVTVLTNSTPPSHASDANYNQYKHNKKRGMYMSPSEHHYDEPHLSLMNHIDVSSPLPPVHCVSPVRAPPRAPSTDPEVQEYVRSPTMSPVPLSLNHSSSPAFSSFSGSGSLGKADTNSEQYHALLPSTLPSGSDAEVIDVKRVGCEGGILSLPNFGVSLTIPEGALPAGLSEDFYLTVGTDSKDRPPIAAHETLLSPVVTVGACVGASLLKPAIVSFHHCACLSSPWTISLLSCHPSAESRGQWQRVAIMDQDDVNTGVYLHLDSSKAHIVTDTLHRFTLVGQPSESDEPCVRNMKLAAFGPRLSPGSVQYSLRVYAIEDTRAALESVVRLERKLGGRLLDKAKSWSLQSDGAPLCLSLEDLSVGWKCRPKSNYQEIPFVHVWSGGSPLLHCAFTLQSSSRGASFSPSSPPTAGSGGGQERLSFSARVQVYQRGGQQRRQMLRISCAESSSTGQSSDSSVPSPRLMSSSLTASGNVTSSLSAGGDGSFRMTSELRRALCSLLDSQDTMGNDWRLLAQLMHMQRFESYFAAQCSPTERLLDLWFARSSGSLPAPSSSCQRGATVQLLSLLRAMDRHDAALLVEHALNAHL